MNFIFCFCFTFESCENPRQHFNGCLAILEFMTVAVAVVAIRSVHTGLYLSISNRGELQGTVS